MFMYEMLLLARVPTSYALHGWNYTQLLLPWEPRISLLCWQFLRNAIRAAFYP